jgi:peroxiredoxin Q/BCP
MTTPREAALKVPQAGEEAPKFKAQAYPSGEHSLDDFAGKKNVILAFYPKDMTPGCTKEMCDFSADLAKFDDAQTQVFGVSCDTLKNHEEFAKKYSLTVTLLADEDATVAKAYGAVREGARMANRVLFVIDKNGVVQHVFEGMPNNAELLAVVEQLP